MPLSQRIDPLPAKLRLKRGAILKIIHERAKRQTPVRPHLAVSHPTVKLKCHNLTSRKYRKCLSKKIISQQRFFINID